MQFVLMLFFVSMTFLPHALFAKTLDHFLAPDEMIQELGLSTSSPLLAPGSPPLTTEDVFQRYGVDVFAEFPVVITIDTSSLGDTAQTVTVYHQGQLFAVFRTSTGREQWEEAPSGKRYYSSTPVGWFAPKYFIKDHHSSIWDAPMELSIFFNGGIAIHATTPDLYEKLGERASGGCVRLTHEDAQTLWDLTASLPKKEVPLFDVQGNMETDPNGEVIRREGSSVLILVINSVPETSPEPPPQPEPPPLT